MTTLGFLLALALIVGAIFAIEGGVERRYRPSGLITWLISGNWPAKIGALLIIVGAGALLRYAALNIELPPNMKLGVGVAMAAMLGFASTLTRTTPKQRTLSLVLGGSASGVAYLTAYSAFVLYGYFDNATGLGLLALTAIVTGVIAVNRNSLSLALLAMVGAYLSPVFAVGDPGPMIVYGYYAAASTLTLAMVAARGWRPLIHLSFLFTLVGGVLFAWNAQYYTPAHFDAMAPLLLVLAALHVAMPIVERRNTSGSWLERLDLIYLLSLPLVTSVLAIVISPSTLLLSTELICLGLIWLIAAAYLLIARREGTALHTIIGAALMIAGAVLRFPEAPWDVIALTGSVAVFAITLYTAQPLNLQRLAGGTVLLLAVVHGITSLGHNSGEAFRNAEFFERLICAALLIYAGKLAKKTEPSLDLPLFHVGAGWAVLTLSREVIRWDVVSLALLAHWLTLMIALTVFALGSRLKKEPTWETFIPLGILLTAPLATLTASTSAAIISLFVGVAALMAFAQRHYEDQDVTIDRRLAVIAVPIVAMLWTAHIGTPVETGIGYVSLTAAAFGAVLVLIAGNLQPERSRGWMPTATTAFGTVLAIALGFATLIDIERGTWPVIGELSCLIGLVIIALSSQTPDGTLARVRPASIIGVALFSQAMLLRWFGPSGDLDMTSIASMQWPSLVSLLWACMGAALTVWSRKKGSRTLWIGGASLLVAAAVKLLLIDLKSLGDLANILAVIAAGGVFLLVGWLAPMPPAMKDTE